MQMHLFEIISLIASFENEEEAGFKRVVTNTCDIISQCVEKHHMDEQEARSI